MKSGTKPIISGFRDIFVIDGFARRALPLEAWNHRAHLVVAVHSLVTLPLEEAVDCIKNGIRDYNERQGVANTTTSGYHETLTCFWIAIVLSELRNLPDSLQQDSVSVATFVADRLANHPTLWKQFYSYDVFRCALARTSWREPDLKRLPESIAPQQRKTYVNPR
jgi:hypothetical protein